MKTLAALYVILAVAAFADTQEAIQQSSKSFPPGSTDLVPERNAKKDFSTLLGSSTTVVNARQEEPMFYLHAEIDTLKSNIEALKRENERLKREFASLQVQGLEKLKPNKSPDRTAPSVTPPAAQEPRH